MTPAATAAHLPDHKRPTSILVRLAGNLIVPSLPAALRQCQYRVYWPPPFAPSSRPKARKSPPLPPICSRSDLSRPAMAIRAGRSALLAIAVLLAASPCLQGNAARDPAPPSALLSQPPHFIPCAAPPGIPLPGIPRRSAGRSVRSFPFAGRLCRRRLGVGPSLGGF
nr:unnamed protein product [Digitaria exilis]